VQKEELHSQADVVNEELRITEINDSQLYIVFSEKVFENLFRKPHGNPEQAIASISNHFPGFT
jgi:hypothetical protein